LKGVESAIPSLALEHPTVWWDKDDSARLAGIPPRFGANVEQVDEQFAAGAVPVGLPHREAALRCGLPNLAFEIETLIAWEIVTGSRAPSLARAEHHDALVLVSRHQGVCLIPVHAMEDCAIFNTARLKLLELLFGFRALGNSLCLAHFPAPRGLEQV